MDISASSNLTICYYPVFNNADALRDHIARTGWYLTCLDPKEVIFVIKNGIKPDFKIPDYFDDNVARFVERLKPRIRFHYVQDARQGVESVVDANHVDAFLLWDDSVQSQEESKRLFNAFRKGKRVWRVDNSNYRFEGSHYIKIGLNTLPNREEAIEHNRLRFLQLTQRLQGSREAYVFGTGPNVALYRNFDYSQGLSIICNSIIFDDKMMEYVQPDVLCFGDPIFHFGPSRYAGEFHKKLQEAVEKYEFTIMIPFNYYRIFLSNFPQFKDFTVAVPFDYEKPYSYDLREDFYVNPFANVLTMLMLPLASTFADEVFILGADGRPESANNYFWSHNKRTQINDQMENIQIVHPSFFQVDYSDYYSRHKRDLQSYLDEGELGGTKYTALTPSYIPCLAERSYFDEKRATRIDRTVAVYDPGFREVGHQVHFNVHCTRMFSQVFAKVVLFDEDNSLERVFSDKPSNVKIVQLPSHLHFEAVKAELDKTHSDISNEVTKLSMPREQSRELLSARRKERIPPIERDFFVKVWRFIEAEGCDLLFLTSEGNLPSQVERSAFAILPHLPFIAAIHIGWKLLNRKDDRNLLDALHKADSLFVLDRFMTNVMRELNSNVLSLPFMVFENQDGMTQKSSSDRATFATVGVINKRRNVPFLVRTMNRYDGPPIEYRLLGKPLDDEGEKVVEMADAFSNRSKVAFHTQFTYLSDAEYEQSIQECDFILIAYDESRKYQVPGIVYQAAKFGTPLVVPKTEPFTSIEHNYPGIFVFYSPLSVEGLHQVLSRLARRGQDYSKASEDARRALRQFVLDNLRDRRVSQLGQAMAELYPVDTRVLLRKTTEWVLDTIVERLTTTEPRLRQVLSEEAIEKIKTSDQAMRRCAEDQYIQRIAKGTTVIDNVIEDDVPRIICDDNELFEKLLEEDLAEAIANNADLIENLVPEKTSTIFGSRYNAKSRSSKYYGFWGKLFGAYDIHKANVEFEEHDKPKLEQLKDIHKGQRGFVICNGPSLGEIDLESLNDEITIGSNGLYLLFENTEFRPTYYVVEDDLIGEDRREDINSKINGPIKFFSQRLAYCVNRGEDVIFLRHAPDRNPWKATQKASGMEMNFSPDVSVASFGGNTVTYTALQILYHMGIREVYLIGADHNYSVPERYDNRDTGENYVIEAEEKDVNHFHPSYFGEGYRWHNPKVHKLEMAYRNARTFYELNGGKIFNATIGGHLEVFERVDYDEVLERPSIRRANELFRSGKYKRALKAYERLLERGGIYKCVQFNARLCRKRLHGATRAIS